MLEYIVVGVIVAAAAFYAARRFMPASWRRRMAYRLGGRESKLANLLNPDPGCGSGCDSCKACAEPEPEPAQRRIITIHKS